MSGDPNEVKDWGYKALPVKTAKILRWKWTSFFLIVCDPIVMRI